MDFMNVKAIEGFVRMCSDGFNQGWHERNGGNLTYRMTDDEVNEASVYFYDTPSDWVDLGITADNLAGEYFIATGSGKFMRNVELDPEDNICIAQLNGAGNKYRVVWGLKNGGRPTSEFPSHLLNHSVKKAATNGEHRVIYHAHTPSVIALTYVLPLDAKSFTNVLWKSMTECPIVFPNGVGVVPWMIPGGAEIAVASSELMKDFDAIVWAHHGLFCSGPDFDTTFGLMHTIEKSAEIYIKALSCGMDIRQTIKNDELVAVTKAFGVQINEGLLD